MGVTLTFCSPMAWKLRELVSGAACHVARVSGTCMHLYWCAGGRHRLHEGDFDLDLTYITPRVIAMALPSFGIEGTYRNPANEVQELRIHRSECFLHLNFE